MTGIDFVDALLGRPLQTLVGVLLGLSIYGVVWAGQANIVHAEVEKQDGVIEAIESKQDTMFELLIRIDENVEILKGKTKQL